MPTTRALAVLVSCLVASGCASLESEDPPELALAKADHAILARPPEGESPPPPDPALEIGGYAYQLGVQYPLTLAISGAWGGTLAAVGDLVIGGLAPLMGSSLQDRIEDTLHAIHGRGPDGEWVWKALPPVSPREKDLYLRDLGEGPPRPLRLVPVVPEAE